MSTEPQQPVTQVELQQVVVTLQRLAPEHKLQIMMALMHDSLLHANSETLMQIGTTCLNMLVGRANRAESALARQGKLKPP